MQTTFLKERKLIVDFTQTMYSLEFENTVNFHYLHHWMWAILHLIWKSYQRRYCLQLLDRIQKKLISSLYILKAHLSFESLLYSHTFIPFAGFSLVWFLPFFVCTLVTKIIVKEIVAFVAILNKERKDFYCEW